MLIKRSEVQPVSAAGAEKENGDRAQLLQMIRDLGELCENASTEQVKNMQAHVRQMVNSSDIVLQSHLFYGEQLSAFGLRWRGDISAPQASQACNRYMPHCTDSICVCFR